LVAPRTFTLPARLAGSQGYAGTAPTAPAELGTSSRSIAQSSSQE
jgi:hypothetical protein